MDPLIYMYIYQYHSNIYILLGWQIDYWSYYRYIHVFALTDRSRTTGTILRAAVFLYPAGYKIVFMIVGVSVYVGLVLSKQSSVVSIKSFSWSQKRGPWFCGVLWQGGVAK